jgi:hypothetical protein
MKRLMLIASVASSTACLSIPPAAEPSCASDSDCNQVQGEVCDEGVCWGNPPQGQFSAIVGPPASAKNRVAAEYPTFNMPDHGWLGDLVVDVPITVAGNLTFSCPPATPCKDMSGTSVIATRASRLPGAPAQRFVATIDASSTDGVSFELKLPRTNRALGDEPYQITIAPRPRAPGIDPSSATTPLPPLRTSLDAMADARVAYEIAATNFTTVSGRVTDDVGNPLPGYRVVARGRWTSDTVVAEVSNATISDNEGRYQLLLSDNLVGGVEIVATGSAANAGVVLSAGLRFLRPSNSGIDLAKPSGLAGVTELAYRLIGTNGNGEVKPIAGATVTMTATVENALRPTYSSALVAGGNATTDADGIARLNLIASRSGQFVMYDVTIQPPATSQFSAVFGDRYRVGQATTRQLEPRVAVHGVVTNSAGESIKNIAVTARPNASYLDGLDSTTQRFALQLSLAAATTNDAGEFVIWVDPPLAAASAYDLVFEPAEGVNAPRWSVDRAVVPTNRMISLAAGPFVAPDVAHVHGRITDPTGRALAGGELRVFRQGQAIVCASANATCVTAPTLLGRGTADENGIVRLTLPRN